MVVAQGMEGEREGKTMAALRPRSRQWTAKVRGGSSSNSKSLRSTDVSDPSLVVPIRSNAKPKFTTKDRHDYVRPYAMDAISVYNERAGTKYELVEPGNITTVLLSRRRLHHIDFTAKKTDVADAPVEMFFAELITLNKVRSVECCRCMGPKKSISGD
ncbi:uncharacterized protein LOC113271651 isoform X2 [Papaver somniferum]|uniref:uncharacterized protein LOC113271651 isoform X2 n=1 Tax=Papaver somniferum TaxID=3469 RepID=UPI000E6FBBA2|nr:uncharacterized protein LOC113271651 isoform X2 [Papaver somniferum]